MPKQYRLAIDMSFGKAHETKLIYFKSFDNPPFYRCEDNLNMMIAEADLRIYLDAGIIEEIPN